MPSHRLPTAHRMRYRIGRGEQGVLTFEPYKSALLPLWRFKTAALAQHSAQQIYARFLAYYDQDDFIGMDMARKFLQMGMTRAKRYANHAGGRKYDRGTGQELERSAGHADMPEKEAASLAFREVWVRAKGHVGYAVLKERFVREQREWEKETRKRKVGEDDEVSKREDGTRMLTPARTMEEVDGS